MYCKKNLDFVALIWEDLAYQIDNIDYKKQDKMFYPRFTKIIIYHFFEKDKSISMRNKTFMHTACDDNLLGTMRFVSRHADTQVYGAIIPKAMKNQALLDFVSYMTYYAIDSGAEPPKSRKSQKKLDSAISSEESSSKKKSAKAKKVAAAKPKPTKKKALVKAERGKGLNVLSEVALSKAAQLKEATKRNKKDFHISQASSLGDGTDFESGVPDEQHHKTLGTNEGTSTKLRVPNVPNYDSESDKESWGDSEEEVDDEDDTKDDEENDDSDANNDDGNDGNDDRIKILVLNQSSIEYEKEEEEEEKVDDEEKTNEEDDEITKELYKDVHVNLGNKYANLTDADQGGTGQQNVSQESGFEQVEEDAHVTLTPVLDTQKSDEPVQSSFVSSNFTSKLLNLKNPSLADNEIASLMDTIVYHEEPGSQTSSLYTVPITAVPAITFVFTTTIPLPPPFFNPLSQQVTPTRTLTTYKATTSFPSLLDFSSVFKFNDRVTNLEKVLSEIKQVCKYAQALSSIPTIVDHYINNKLGEAIQKAIVVHNLDCREEAQAEKRDCIEIVDTSMRAMLKEEVNTQLPRILPQAVSDFATPPKIDAYIYDWNFSSDKECEIAFSKSKCIQRYLISRFLWLYSRVDPHVTFSNDTLILWSKQGIVQCNLLSFQVCPCEEPSHTVDDLGVQQHQEFDTSNNDEQPAEKEVSKADWFKKPEQLPTPDPDWNKRQHVDFWPPQTWISQVAHAKEPTTSFDELLNTPINFSVFVLN
nr:hypothetical protein [Tanacetum cinerariifolium]